MTTAVAASRSTRSGHNLPSEVAGFVGREREVAELKRLLPQTRLLTLTGCGGCGKTRLALRVAADLVPSFPDGVWLVECAPLADSALVPRAVAAVLGGAQSGGAEGFDLTEREREVATLIAQGLTNRQIGTALFITEGTARLHVKHILSKLGFTSRAQIAGWAVAQGLAEAPEAP